MQTFANYPIPYHPDKKYITPKHLFTNVWREGFYLKLSDCGIYDIESTFDWLQSINKNN